MQFAVGVTLDAITAIAVMFLLSAGLYIIFGMLRVINMAHGDFMMLGAYATSILQERNWPFFPAALMATCSIVVVGIAVERFLIRPLYDRSNLSTLLMTAGIGLCIREISRIIFGPAGRFVDPPTTHVLQVFGSPYPVFSLLLTGISLAIAVLAWIIINTTRWGLIVQATIENPSLAESNGIDTRRTCRWAFAAGSGLAGLAGALIAPLASVTPYMGVEWSLSAFLVVIVAGGATASPAPVLWGSALLAGSRTLLNVFFGITSATIGMLLLVIAVLFIRPAGMVAKK